MRHALKAYAPLPLRLMAGLGFLYHGLPKFTPEGHQMFVGMLQGIGIPEPVFAAWLVTAAEVGGGLMLVAGWLVRLAVLPLIVDMLVAMFTVHWVHGFNTINMVDPGPPPAFGMPGIELNLLYLAMLAGLWFAGAGPFSLDARREKPAVSRERAPAERPAPRQPVGAGAPR